MIGSAGSRSPESAQIALDVMLRDRGSQRASSERDMADSDIFPVYRQPDWEPLRRMLAAVYGDGAAGAASAFWFVGYERGPRGAGELRLYEHSTTHGQLAVDRSGNAWQRDEAQGVYVRIESEAALIQVLV